MVFDLNPFKPVTFVYKVRPCTLPFRPAEAVPYLSSKYGQQRKRVSRKRRSLPKFLTAQNVKGGKAVAVPPIMNIGKADYY